MSAGIIAGVDRGVVQGTTWHDMPEYVQQKNPVTLEQAREVLDYEIEKQRLGYMANGVFTQVDAFALTRDTHTLVDSVGMRYTAPNNVDMLDYLAKTVLKEYPQLQIESVGTLWAGNTAFLNLKVNEFGVKGDKSQTISRMMWYNPLGYGGYKTCAHDIRVVCNNTLRLASKEGERNGTLRSISHTAMGAEKVQKELDSLAKHFFELESLTIQLRALAKVAMTPKTVFKFINALIPISDEPYSKENPESVRSTTMRKEKQQAIIKRFESDQDLTDPVNRSAYGMLQAVTYTLDHAEGRCGNDRAGVIWDGLVGARSFQKIEAMQLLQKIND